MDLLDLRTLILADATIILTCGLAILALSFMIRQRRSILWWGFGNLTLGSGILLVGLREHLPTLFSIFMGNVLVLYGSIMVWVGIRIFFKKPSRLLFLFSLPVPVVAIIYQYSETTPDFVTRCYVVIGAMALLEMGMAQELFRNRKIIHKVSGGVFASLGLFYIGWLLSFDNLLASPEMLASGALFKILYIASIVFQVAFVSSLIMLIGDRLNEEIREAKDEAVAANQAKSDFLACMSHEIRTPMSTIIGLSELISRSDKGGENTEDLNSIHMASRSLLTLIDDILDYSKIDAGQTLIENSSFYLDDVTNHLMELTGVQALSKGLEFGLETSPDIPIKLSGDPNRLRQVLVNLVSNAIKFTQKGFVSIQIHKKSESHDKIWLDFEITDSGIGIPDKDKDKLFGAFTQLDGSSTRVYGGVGLGLAICRRLVRLMDGQINVTSVQGKGTQFIVSLPFSVPPGPDAEAFLSFWKGEHALVMGNSSLISNQVSSHLQSFGFEVKKVNGLAEIFPVLMAVSDKQPLLIVAERSSNPTINYDLIQLSRAVDRAYSPPAVVFYSRDLFISEDKIIGHEVIPSPMTTQRLFLAVANALSLPPKMFPTRFARSGNSISQFSHRPQVLLVEDSGINRDVMAKMLSSFNVEVHTAQNGLVAVEKARLHDYSVIFMDIQMPEMDGFEAAQTIFSEQGEEASKIVALSADSTIATIQKAREIGFSEYLTKPVTIDSFYSSLSQWIKKDEDKTTPHLQEESHQSDLAQQLPGFDIPSALRDCFGDEDFYRQRLKDFADRLDEFQRDFKSAHNSGDMTTVKHLTHSLKGTSALLKAMELKMAFGDYDAALKKGEQHLINESIDALLEAISNTVSRLRQLA